MKLTWQPEWEESSGENGSMYMYGEFLHCSSETVMPLLIDCTPKQNKKLRKKMCAMEARIHMPIIFLCICCLICHEVFGLKALFTFFNVCELKHEALETLKIRFDQFPEKSMYVTM